MEQSIPMADRSAPRRTNSPGASAVRRAMSRMFGSDSSSEDVIAEKRVATQVDCTRTATVALIALQHADGSWDLDDHFARAIGARNLRVLESAMGAESRDPNARRAWATALAIGWLRARAADLRGEWQLIADKGLAWLANVAPGRSGSGSWMEHATRWHEATPAS